MSYPSKLEQAPGNGKQYETDAKTDSYRYLALCS